MKEFSITELCKHLKIKKYVVHDLLRRKKFKPHYKCKGQGTRHKYTEIDYFRLKIYFEARDYYKQAKQVLLRNDFYR